MRPRPLVTVLCLALVLIAPLAGAQDGQRSPIDVGLYEGDQRVQEVRVAVPYALQATVDLPERTNTSWRVFLNASVAGDALPSAQNHTTTNGTDTLTTFVQFTVPTDAEGTLTIDYTVTVQSLYTGPPPSTNGTDGNQTDGNETGENATAPQQSNATWETEFTQQGPLVVDVAAPPTPPPEGPPAALIGGAVVAVLVIVGGVVAYKKWPRAYKHEAGPRSQTMRDMEGGGGSGGGGPGQAAAQQEPKEHPQVKILEARAEDVRRMIELAEERYERGDLTEHQFNMIRDKKEAELQEIEQEIEGYRSG